MEKRTINPRDVDLQDLIERGTQLHGHLGPYLVAGIRMGLLALDLLESSGYFGIEAESEAGDVPPVSCLSDGIQIGCGCTPGKGNLRVLAHGLARARFVREGGRAMTIALRPEMEEAFRVGDGQATASMARSVPIGELLTWQIESSA